MQIWSSPYQLEKKEGGHRRGALLRFDFGDGFVGFADCHPWQEFGDLTIQEELRALAKNQPTRLIKRSLYYAKLDARARKNSLNWFENKKIPESRALLSKVQPIDDLLNLGFRFFKFKIRPPIDSILLQLERLSNQKIDLCLDANSSLSIEEFEKLFSLFPRILFEDPIPFQKEIWEHYQARGASLAADKELEAAIGFPRSAKYLVIKPAIHDEAAFQKIENQKIIVTSYLDHPVGQLCAAYTASQFASNSICGITTHHFYMPTNYSTSLGSNPNLIPPAGTGLGFNNFLENEPWEKVIFSF